MTEILWFPFGKFQFRRKEVQWVLEHAVMFEQGRWPRKPPTGYIEQPGIGHAQVKAEAGFVRPAIIWAEITARLEQCGEDGLNCRDFFLGQLSLAAFCRLCHCTEDVLDRSNGGVISYVASGPCRRWIACPLGCPDVELCPKPLRPPVTYNEWRLHVKRQPRLAFDYRNIAVKQSRTTLATSEPEVAER